MEIFDSINLYIASHPVMLNQLEMMFRIKFWLFLALACYFLFLPYREKRKEAKRQIELAKKKRDRFLA